MRESPVIVITGDGKIVSVIRFDCTLPREQPETLVVNMQSIWSPFFNVVKLSWRLFSSTVIPLICHASVGFAPAFKIDALNTIGVPEQTGLLSVLIVMEGAANDFKFKSIVFEVPIE